MTLAGLAGCADTSRELRAYTYPKSFEYVDKAELRTSMHTLASDMLKLDALLRQEAPKDRRERAVALLTDLQQTVAGLSGGTSMSNHPGLHAHLAQFERDVGEARAALLKEAPDYFLAGSVVGACTNELSSLRLEGLSHLEEQTKAHAAVAHRHAGHPVVRHRGQHDGRARDDDVRPTRRNNRA